MKKQRKKLLIKFLLIFVITIGFISLFLLKTDYFNINEIKIEKTEFYSEERIILASSININDNIFKHISFNAYDLSKLRSTNAEKNIESLSYIKNAIVSVKLPKTIHISIEEREAIAGVVFLENKLIIDKEGYVLEIRSKEDDEFFDIKGLQFNSYAVGDLIDAESEVVVEIMIKIVNLLNDCEEHLNYDIISKIDWMDVRDLDEILLSIDGRIDVNLGDCREIDINKMSEMCKITLYEIGKEEKGLLDCTGEYPSFRW